jgi:H+/gluconate symporter-like permease
MGLLGIALGLLLLLTLAFRSWSVLLLAPAAALVAALFAGEPLLAHWTQTFMGGTARFLAQFFPIFLLGALFGKLMDDSGSVTAIANYMTLRLGEQRAILAVVLAGALVTYGGVSLFVAFFVLAPMAQALFRAAAIPRRLMPAAIALGTSTFTMSAMPGTPAIQNAIPMPFFGTTPFAAPGLGVIASAVMLGFGLWWLGRAEASARRALPGPCAGAGDRSLLIASRRCDWIRHARQPSPQWSGRDAPRGMRVDPPRELFRHRDGRHRRPYRRARRRDRAGLGIRFVLSKHPSIEKRWPSKNP